MDDPILPPSDLKIDQLSLESQFSYWQIERLADQLSREQAIDLVKRVYLLYLAQKQVFVQSIKNTLHS